MKKLLLFLSSMFLLTYMNAQSPEESLFRQNAKDQIGAGGIHIQKLDHPICLYRAEDIARKSHIHPPAGMRKSTQRSVNEDCGNIEVTYIGFDDYPEAMDAFQYAVEIWESQITSAVPIKVTANFTPLDPGVLGSAGPNFIVRDFGAGVPGTWYGSALGDALAGVDLIPGEADIIANFSSSFGWYFGRDGNPPPGTYDFATVVIHELGHGLGFFGSADAIPSPLLGIYGFGGLPTVYDTYVQNSAGLSPLDIDPPGAITPALGAYFQSNDLFVNAPSAVAANGSPPAIFAPASFQPGSSYSHWDETVFPPGTAQSLMTPFLGFQEAIHDPGTATIGMFADHGWSEVANCLPPDPVNDGSPCKITGISLDPVVPFPICDINGAVGPPGSHVIYVRVEGINPLNQPLDPSQYAAKVKGKDYPIFTLGYDFFEGEVYFYLGIAGIPSDGKKNMQVKITLQNGCVAVGPRLYTAPTCDEELALSPNPETENLIEDTGESVQVFPNPSSGRFTLRTGDTGEGLLQIFTVTGQMIYEVNVSGNQNRNIDLTTFDSGMYILHLKGESDLYTRQLIVNR